MNQSALQLLTAAVILSSAAPAGAEPEAEHAAPGPSAPRPSIELGGYGELLFSYFDHGADQTQEGGSPEEHRLVFDTARFVAKIEGELAWDIEFEAEVELEHGGTGGALELEYEEFGEYESEIEKGGEVLVEELYLEKAFTDWLEVKAGRFYVAVGLLSDLYRPTSYLGPARPESETTVLPAVWDEQGVSVELTPPGWELTFQVVNGLDSTGFSSQLWIAQGHQARFELVRATDLAVVGRADFTAVPGLVVGASGYFGDTTANRPKPDMDGVFAPLVLGDLHLVYEHPLVRVRAVGIWGHLSKAEEISDKNRRLSNNLGVLRTPVASQALAVWAEAGLNLTPWLGLAAMHRVEPFLRFEYYDTMFGTGPATFDNPRFERTLFAGGVAYTASEQVVAKLGLSHRRLGSSAFNDENAVQLSLGFQY